ncbi:alpha-galactosidase [Paenibacillus yanchengensis]|uniref:Alpha-galactosidase n=1 Tax=Paenibacillus yanchengensis TaxID=2035833 RepID=A0ABW4YHT6_9BACL
MIKVDEQRLLFLLNTEQMSYGIGVSSKGHVLHGHWGEQVQLDDLASLFTPYYHSHFDTEVEREREEYTDWGGLIFTEPALKVTFDDHVRDLQLIYSSYRVVGNHTLELTLMDKHYPLQVTLIYQVIRQLNVIERKATIINNGVTAVQLETVQSAVWNIPALEQYRVTSVTGKWQEEFQVQQQLMSVGKYVMDSRRGITSHHANPWFAIDNGTATEQQGAVWFGALAWSGNWKITVEQSIFHHLRVVGGIQDFDFSWQLAAGEQFETPTFVGGYGTSGFSGMSRVMHEYHRQYVMPEVTKHTVRPILYNSWEATEFHVQIEEQVALAKKAADMGVELFVIDDGWFGERNHDKAGLGDWYVNRDKFPNGLGELITQVNALGLEFGLWVEPEMVNADSDLYRAHPDWIYHFPHRESTLARNQLVLNVAKPEVKQYIIDFMSKLLAENNISFIKWDMNRAISEPGYMNVRPAQQREMWVRHVYHIYDIWEHLRVKFPHVAFETCASGGGRIDFGMLRYAEQAWVSDNTDAFDRLKIQEGFSYMYSPQTMMCWVTDSPGHANKRSVSLAYRFHVAMTGALGIGGNLNKWAAEELVEAAAHINTYKQIRTLVQQGQQHRLQSPRHGELTAIQYTSKEADEAVVFTFLHAQQFGNSPNRLRLANLHPSVHYRVEYVGLTDEQAAFTMSGAGLMQIGIPLTLGGDFDSQLVRIREEIALLLSRKIV